MSGTEVLDILALAHALVDAGWTQNATARRADGTATFSVDPNAAVYCVSGALLVAAVNRLDLDPLKDWTGQPDWAVWRTADDLVVAALTLFSDPVDYNDAPGRRKRDVLRLLERAAGKVGKG
jgi:hypothetical protein